VTVAGATAAHETLPPAAAHELLERAVSYARGSLAGIGVHELARRTPCEQWDLAALLEHMADSLAVICEAARVGVVLADPPPADPVERLVETIRTRACTVLSAWEPGASAAGVVLGDRVLPRTDVALVGALEVTTHGWDVAVSRGLLHPVPDGLARRLLPVAHRVVTPLDRPHRFGPARTVRASATAEERLLAHLGRGEPHMDECS
jgi:uncharacterized protein (TIGR03086 family)